ncbi:hypothetical protein N9W79_00680 [bacterium]|nr:hypothetical protein [bacterium]
MIKPKPLAYFMTAVGILGNAYVYYISPTVDANVGAAGSSFRSLYYFMIVPMFLTTGLIYAITKHEEKHGRSKSDRVKIYLTSGLLALSLTVHAGYLIKEAKAAAGFSFPASAKEKMEKYKTDMFKGRLKKFKDPNPDTSHVPYEEQVRTKQKETWEDENGKKEKKEGSEAELKNGN